MFRAVEVLMLGFNWYLILNYETEIQHRVMSTFGLLLNVLEGCGRDDLCLIRPQKDEGKKNQRDEPYYIDHIIKPQGPQGKKNTLKLPKKNKHFPSFPPPKKTWGLQLPPFPFFWEDEKNGAGKLGEHRLR